MRYIIVFILIGLIVEQLLAQPMPNWQWLNGGGSQSRPIGGSNSMRHDVVSNMLVDDSGNVFIAATAINEISWADSNYYFPSYTPQKSHSVAFISKYNSCGEHQWSKYITAPTSDISCIDMCMYKDKIIWVYQGNSIQPHPIKIGSSPSSTDTSFNDIYMPPTQDLRTCLFLRSSDGKLTGMHRLGDDTDTSGLFAVRMITDKNGNLWSIGSGGIENTIFDGVNYSQKLYFMQLSNSYTSVRHFPISDIGYWSLGEKSQDHKTVMAVNGHLYSCGTWGDSVNFISDKTTKYRYNQPVSQFGLLSGFYLHYDSTGKLINHRIGNGPASQFQSMDIDEEGNVYLLMHGPDTIPYFDNIQAVTANRDTFVDHLMVVKMDKRDSVIGHNVIRIALGEPNTGYRPPLSQTYYGKLKVNPKTQEVYIACRVSRDHLKIDSAYIWETQPVLIPSTESVVIKLDKNLKYAWNSKTITNDNTLGTSGSARTTYPEQLGIDGKGNIVLGGTFNYGILIDTPYLSLQRPQNANQWIFFAKYGYPCNSDFSLIKPYDPTQLSAQEQSISSINLNWTNNSNIEWGFYVYQSLNSNGPYTLIDSTSQGVTQYLNTGLQSNTKYYYRVTAFNNAGVSDSSNIASATTLATVGIEEVANNRAWVYPNPAYSHTQVELDEKITSAQLNLYDASGRKIKEQLLTRRVNMVSLAGLAAGIYIYHVTDEREERIGKGILAIEH